MTTLNSGFQVRGPIHDRQNYRAGRIVATRVGKTLPATASYQRKSLILDGRDFEILANSVIKTGD
jgi:hypothetical protein